MNEDSHNFYKLRREGKTYISKVFTFGGQNMERIRNVNMVVDGSDSVKFGEIDGAICLRLSGKVRKTQVTALISQDDREIKRVTLQTFKEREGDRFESVEKHEFTFRTDEFTRLLEFLSRIKFIDLSNTENFHIEDISTKAGPKAIIDASDRGIVDSIKSMSASQRKNLLDSLQPSLTDDEINILLGRKRALAEFEDHMRLRDWSEDQWQNFFDREQWVFGYGLDYRVMRQFGREMTVGAGGVDNKDKPVIDFLMTFSFSRSLGLIGFRSVRTAWAGSCSSQARKLPLIAAQSR